MGQGRAVYVDPQGAPRRAVLLALLGVLAVGAVWFVEAWAGDGVSSRRRPPAAAANGEEDAGGSQQRRRARRARALSAMMEAHEGEDVAGVEPESSSGLGRAAFVLLIGASESAATRADLIAVLGAAGDPANLTFLEEYAARGAGTDDGYAAQRVLMQHYPESWPARAADEYAMLAGDGTHSRGEDSYWLVSRHRPRGWSWSKAYTGWGRSAWDSEHSYYAPPAPAEEWRGFLERYPGFMSSDDAAWHLARALHAEGAPPMQVLLTLDRAFAEPDGDSGRLIWAGLRHYLFERAPEAALRSLARSGRVSPQTRYAAAYAVGLRHLWRLEFENAAEVWSTLPPLPEEGLPAAFELRWQDGGPLHRWELCQRLIPLEQAWRRHRHSARGTDAFLDLIDAVLAIDREIGWRRGFFEPWLLVDIDLDHPLSLYVGDELERLWRRSRGAQRARIEVLRENLGIAGY